MRRAQRDAKPGVYIGYCHPDSIDSAWHNSMMHLLLHDAAREGHVTRHGGFINVGSGPRIASARNTVVARFLDQNAEWLLMLDTDMVFTPNLIERMLAVADPEKVPIVGGLCFAGGKGASIHPTMYQFLRDDDGDLVSTRMETYPENQLVEVNGTGAACLLMHRDALEKIGEAYFKTGAAWFAETYALGQDFGEDITFCLRAQALGIPIHVHTGIEVGHRKLHVLNGDVYERQRKDIAEMGQEAFTNRYIASLGLTEGTVRTSG